MIKVVVLILTVWNTSNGDKLYESKHEYKRFAVENRIEECLRSGVRLAHKLTDIFRGQGYAASTNVDCHWEDRPGAKA